MVESDWKQKLRIAQKEENLSVKETQFAYTHWASMPTSLGSWLSSVTRR